MRTQGIRPILLASPGLLVIAMGIAIAADGPKGQSSGNTERAYIDELSEAIVARTERAEELRDTLADRQNTTDQLARDLAAAEEILKTARAAQKQLLEVTGPQERQSIQKELASMEDKEKKARRYRDWSAKAFGEHVLPEHEKDAYEILYINTQARLTKSQKRRDDFEQAMTKEVARLESERSAAEAQLNRVRVDYNRAKARQERVERNLAAVALSPDEEKALTRLDEAIELRSQQKADLARARLEEARKLWVGEERRRAEGRRQGLDARVQEAANQARERAARRSNGS